MKFIGPAGSIRRTLMLGVLSTTLLVLCASVYISYTHSAHEIDEVFDAELAQATRLAQALLLDHPELAKRDHPLVIDTPLQQLSPHQPSADAERALDGHKYEQLLALQVHDRQGKLLLTSSQIGHSTLAPLQAGYHEMQRQGSTWICFVLWDATRQLWITAAQQQHARDELSWYMVQAQLMPLVIALVPLLVLLVSVMLRSLAPLSTLTRLLRASKPADLTPITTPLPTELQPVQQAINQLLSDINAHMQQERRFIADASHELRTPLANLRLHTQLLQQGSPEDQAQALQAVQQSSQQLSYLVEQLLSLARLEQQGQQLQRQDVGDLADLVAQALSRMTSSVVERVDWQLALDPTLHWQLEPALMVSLLRNLCDNAARYAPTDTPVQLASRRVDGALELVISNRLADLSLDVTRLGERFYRGTGQQHISGSGLGLSIVQRIAQLQQLTLQVSIHAGHFVVTLRQPHS